jgi:hypothetical protein
LPSPPTRSSGAPTVTDQPTKAGNETFTFAANGNRNNGGYATDRANRLVNDPAYVYTYVSAHHSHRFRGADGVAWKLVRPLGQCVGVLA